MTLLTTQQSLTVGDVTNIVVTPLVRDEDTGLFVRELRIFTTDAERTKSVGPHRAAAAGDDRRHPANREREPRLASHRRASLGVLSQENRP